MIDRYQKAAQNSENVVLEMQRLTDDNDLLVNRLEQMEVHVK